MSQQHHKTIKARCNFLASSLLSKFKLCVAVTWRDDIALKYFVATWGIIITGCKVLFLDLAGRLRWVFWSVCSAEFFQILDYVNCL